MSSWVRCGGFSIAAIRRCAIGFFFVPVSVVIPCETSEICYTHVAPLGLWLLGGVAVPINMSPRWGFKTWRRHPLRHTLRSAPIKSPMNRGGMQAPTVGCVSAKVNYETLISKRVPHSTFSEETDQRFNIRLLCPNFDVVDFV